MILCELTDFPNYTPDTPECERITWGEHLRFPWPGDLPQGVPVSRQKMLVQWSDKPLRKAVRS